MSKRTEIRKSVRKSAAEKHSSADRENNWVNWHLLTGHWQSDIAFFEDEMKFFRSLIDRYFRALIDEKFIERTRAIAITLADLEDERRLLGQKVSSHRKNLAALMENPFSHDAQTTADEHQVLEIAIADFVKHFRKGKIDIFLLTEPVLQSQKASHLLGNG